MRLPGTAALRLTDTHRLIPAKYSDDGASVLARIADNDAHLQDIFDLDHATNDRLARENDLLPGIGRDELLAGSIPHFRIVNAAFCHAHPLGGRFNGPDRGAWYAGFAVETSLAEVMHHRRLDYLEIGWDQPDLATYADFLANFDAEFHDIRGDAEFAPCLDPDSHRASQALAEALLDAGSAGIVYPSARRPGDCLACFRPALVNNVRKGQGWALRWDGQEFAPAEPAV